MNKITVEITIKASLDNVWKYWNEPEHIIKWAFASDDWEVPNAENDLKTGGKFKTTMTAKDKSASFDFTGIYTTVEQNKIIEYDMDKNQNEEVARHVKVEFYETAEGTKIIETFDAENENTETMQKNGWQSILNNFKRYVESQ